MSLVGVLDHIWILPISLHFANFLIIVVSMCHSVVSNRWIVNSHKFKFQNVKISNKNNYKNKNKIKIKYLQYQNVQEIASNIFNKMISAIKMLQHITSNGSLK